MGIRNTLSTKRQKRIEQMYGFDPFYGEDRSRVRHRTSALNLAMIRRAVVSVAVSAGSANAARRVARP